MTAPALPTGWELRYSPTGERAHAVLTTQAEGIDGSSGTAACGRPSPFGGWHGTGSQAEYERAAGLPLCQPCARRLREETSW